MKAAAVHSSSLRRSGWIPALAGLLGLAWVTPAPAVVHLGLFDLDGNPQDADTSALPDDWEALHLDDGNADAFTGVVGDPGLNTVFTGGGSKDVNNIGKWKWKNDAGGIPDKNDITNAYAASYSANGDLILYFGADRFANDGNAQLGFWFFQNHITRNDNGTFNGTHVAGDILVLVNFEQGGVSPQLEVLEWVSSGGDASANLKVKFDSVAALCSSGSEDACAITNGSAVSSPWPYTPKSGSDGVFPAQSFFEGVANITNLVGGAPCFTTFMAETRSSSSVTATLKDFVLEEIPVCGISVTKICENPRLSGDGTKIVYDVSGEVENTGFGTVTDVTVVDDNATPGSTSDDQVLLSGATLAAGGTASYSGTFETTQNGAVNTVTASASGGAGAAIPDATANAQCPNLQLSPDISVTKDCVVSLDDSGGAGILIRIDVSGKVCNTGDAPLGNVSVEDDSGTPDDPSDDQFLLQGATLEVGDPPGDENDAGVCRSFSGSYTPKSVNSTCPGDATFGDTVTASGAGPLGSGNAVNTATAHCDLCPAGGCPD